jgi:hypothetical protein
MRQNAGVLPVVIAAVLAALAVAVAALIQRRTRPDPPTQPRSYPVPAQLDRADFTRPEAPWLVAVFSSATCASCASVRELASVLECADVAVEEVEAVADRDRHLRYGVEAVPMVVVADADGVVRASFLGTPTAADLWAAVAELREPGSTPTACDHHGSTA